MNAPLQTGFRARSKIRFVRQTEITECGLACLAMIASSHHLEIDLGTIRRYYAPSLRGSALKELMGVADELGFASRALKLPPEQVRNLHMPAMLFWDLNHYVVVEKARGSRVFIHDPAGGSKWFDLEELSGHFTGIALELRPIEDFQTGRFRDRLRLPQLWRRMTGLKRAAAQTLVLSIVMQAFVLSSPYYIQVAVDSAVPALDQDLLTVLALGFGLFVLLNAVASMLRSFVLLSAGTSLSFGIAANVARRLFRLPISWFERRHVGDVLSRFQSIAPIQQALTQGAVAALLDGILAILTLAVMFYYSAALAAVALFAFVLYAAVRWLSFSFERRAQETSLVSRAAEQSMLIESIRGVVTLRLFNREAARHSQWQNRLTDALNADINVARIAIWQQNANGVILGLENIVFVWLAIGFVIEGGFSLGMAFAFLAYKTQFLTRSASLIDQGIVFRMLGLHLERLSDVALADEDGSFSNRVVSRTHLGGSLALRDCSFRYSSSDPLVLRGLQLTIEPGEHVAITGPSGGGKTTLVKLLLGLIEPESGEFLVDGQPLHLFGHKNYRNQVAAVLQDDSLFAGSIADNIALFEDAPDMQQIVEAARAAAIHDDVAAMPMGYETLVGDMGSSLSGGQKQRVLLARALYRRPRLLILDEGTAHLDIQTERKVNGTISALGITRVIIAHRSETIAAADRVLVLTEGKLTDLKRS